MDSFLRVIHGPMELFFEKSGSCVKKAVSENGKICEHNIFNEKNSKENQKSITGEFVRMGVVRLSLKTVINSVDGQFALTLWHSSSPSAKENILFPSNKMSLSEIMETKASPEKIIY